MVHESTPKSPRASQSMRLIVWAFLLIAGVGGAVGAACYVLTMGEPEGTLEADSEPRSDVLSVNTVYPQQQTLVRTLEQPGSILPYAQAELYAKTSGYLRSLRRDCSPEVVAGLVSQPFGFFTLSGSVLGGTAPFVGSTAIALRQGPVVDIGSHVEAGDLLLDIDVPERDQDVHEKEALVFQREQEVAQAKTIINTYQAAVESAKALEAQAASDVKRYTSEHLFRKKELVRIRELVGNDALERRVEDEKLAQVEAAQAAVESSRGKTLTAKADISLALSKLATARADVRVKEAQLEVARADLKRAHILLHYCQLEAPFRGIITYRGVDEGDFVQNSQSGQSRHLMTITAMDKVKIGLKVPSLEGVLVRVGAGATVSVDSRPGETFKGRVSRTRGMLDSASRTLEVEIDLDNRDHRLMPGMYGHVRLPLLTKENAWVVPANALFSRNKVNYILLVKDGVARRQPVRIIFDDGERVEVLKLIKGKEVPLSGSDELIVSSKGEIADGQKVESPHPEKP